MGLMVILFFLMVLAVDALLIFTPWLMPDSECFAVTVPHGERDKEPLRSLMQRYAVHMAIISALCALAWPIAFWLFALDLNTTRGAGLFALVITVSMCVPALASFVLMLRYRHRVQDIQQERGWRVEHARSVAFVGDEDFPKPISLLWNLAYMPLIAGMAIFGLVNYDRFPDMIPMNVDFNGTVANYVPKSLVSVLFPAFMSAFMGVVFFATHAGIVRSKKPIDPDAPASSALAYGRFARAHSIMLLVGGLVLSGLTGILFYASTLGTISMLTAAIAEMAMAVVLVVVVMAISVLMGQSGGRIAAVAPEGSMARNDDAYWKLGTFYCNRDDPSTFVPKRFGVGWTVNLGNPLSWAALAGLILITVLFCWVMSLVAA